MDKAIRFGIEIEMTGITRKDAALAAQTVLGGELVYRGSYYDTYELKTLDGRKWKFTYDGSIRCETKRGRVKESASRLYSVELVSPILTYEEDIKSLQDVIRTVRRAGAFTNSSSGIHIHLDGEPHTPRSIRNFVNIIYARNDLFYKALGIEAQRARYCKRMEEQPCGNHEPQETDNLRFDREHLVRRVPGEAGRHTTTTAATIFFMESKFLCEVMDINPLTASVFIVFTLHNPVQSTVGSCR